MRRVSIAVCAGLSTALFAVSLQGCSGSDPEPNDSGSQGSNSNNTSAGTSSSSAGASSGSAGASSGSAGTPAGGTSGGESAGGATATAGTSAGGAAGSGTAGTAGSAAPGTCVGKIENKVTACSAACFDYQCGVHRLGLKDCECPAGVYECESCTYSGTEEIIQTPTEAPPVCADTDVALEGSQTPCTKGDRCYYHDAANVKDRLCACWDDGLGSTAWDCDTYPGDWLKPT